MLCVLSLLKHSRAALAVARERSRTPARDDSHAVCPGCVDMILATPYVGTSAYYFFQPAAPKYDAKTYECSGNTVGSSQKSGIRRGCG